MNPISWWLGCEGHNWAGQKLPIGESIYLLITEKLWVLGDLLRQNGITFRTISGASAKPDDFWLNTNSILIMWSLNLSHPLHSFLALLQFPPLASFIAKDRCGVHARKSLPATGNAGGSHDKDNELYHQKNKANKWKHANYALYAQLQTLIFLHLGREINEF